GWAAGAGGVGMIVKICGITRPEDAQLAVSLGATALGFIFWPSSPRAVLVHDARAIVAGLPPSVTSVGVFVNAARDEIDAIADAVGLSAVQLHGEETPELARMLRRRVIKAIPLDSQAEDQAETWTGTTVLLDAHDPSRRGGTGRVIDWNRAVAIARRHEVILA